MACRRFTTMTCSFADMTATQEMSVSSDTHSSRTPAARVRANTSAGGADARPDARSPIAFFWMVGAEMNPAITIAPER